jgi:hypothetical protein
MALDPATLKARQICKLKALAAWTAANWRGRVEGCSREHPPPPRDDEPDEV